MVYDREMMPNNEPVRMVNHYHMVSFTEVANAEKALLEVQKTEQAIDNRIRRATAEGEFYILPELRNRKQSAWHSIRQAKSKLAEAKYKMLENKTSPRYLVLG